MGNAKIFQNRYLFIRCKLCFNNLNRLLSQYLKRRKQNYFSTHSVCCAGDDNSCCKLGCGGGAKH